MPGIVGCITRSPHESAEADVRRMAETLRHENFYVTGTWVEESQGVYVGWVARRALSPTECHCETNGETSFSRFPERSFRSRARPSV